MNTDTALRIIVRRSWRNSIIRLALLYVAAIMLFVISHPDLMFLSGACCLALVLPCGLEIYRRSRRLGGAVADVSLDSVRAICEELCLRLRVPVPKLVAYKDADVNGCAIGSTARSTTIVLSTGAVQAESSVVRALAAHELGHLACGHMLFTLMSVPGHVLLIAGFAAFGHSLAGSWDSPLALLPACYLTLRLMIAESRLHEYEADAVATVLCGRQAVIRCLLYMRVRGLAAIANALSPARTKEQWETVLWSDWEKMIPLAKHVDDVKLGLWHQFKQAALPDAHPSFSLRAKNMWRIQQIIGGSQVK